ncbi:hypothetical protein BJ165DRAFT_1523114 [Panaeolus papilionaceus]|nr:hypothetical protein BJ165DRAFT_1523114 [Panaeolus papilionaceus]
MFSSRPPTVSTAVWAQLLRGIRPTKDGSQSNPTQPDISHLAPPHAPLDKNATSMRVLLHDTQSNFERFTVEVENLFRSIAETKKEIKTVGCLYAKDRESLVSDIIDLVNRSQRELQKSIGEPSQTPSVDALFKDVNGALSSVNQRLDSIQSFNETHSRALQTQMQSIQILLENQGKIITAVAPLLPLVQALSPHLETLRGSIAESLEKTIWKSMASASASQSPPGSRKRKRSNVTASSHKSPFMRQDSNYHSSDYPQEQEKRRRMSGGRNTPIRPSEQHRFQEECENVGSYQPKPTQQQSIRQPQDSASASIHDLPMPMDRQGNAPHIATEFMTPRRPLIGASNSVHRLPPPMMRKASITSKAGPTRHTPPQGDKSLHRLASAAPISSGHEKMPPPNVPGPLFFANQGQPQRPTLSDILRAENQNPTSRSLASHPTPDVRHAKTQTIFPSPRFFSNGPGGTSAQIPTPQQGTTRPGLDRRDREMSNLPSSTPKNLQPLKSINSLPFGQINIKPGSSIVSQASSKAGRAGAGRQSLQQVEGRRFIPLVDSDDEIEDDTGE